MRDLEVIDGDLRLLAAVRAHVLETGVTPNTRVIDQLLDERLEVVAQSHSNI